MGKIFFTHFFILCMVVCFALTTFAQNKSISKESLFSASSGVNISKRPSQEGGSTVLQWDDGVNANSIGLTNGGDMEVAARFDASIMTPLAGQSLTQIEVYIAFFNGTLVLNVYGQDTPNNAGPLLYSEDVTSSIILDSWNTFTLDIPVPITGEDIWVGYIVAHLVNEFPAGIDDGPHVPDDDWVNSGSWGDLFDVTGGQLDGNWNIHAYIEQVGPPCPIDPATNPDPVDGATDVDVNLAAISWANGAGANNVEVWFDGALVYDGPTISTWPIPGSLTFSTTYSWQIIGKNDTCSVPALTWSFTTTVDPDLICIFSDNFDSDISQWTEVGPDGIGNWLWSKSNNAIGSNTGELNFHWLPSFDGESYLMSDVIPSDGLNLHISFKHFLDWFADPMTVGLAYTNDDGANWTSIWQIISPNGNVGPAIVELQASGSANFRLGFYWTGDTFSIDEWWIDEVFACYIVPVELTSFTANVNKRNVILNWNTATETNNHGFEVQKSTNGSEFVLTAFVEGNGTTTEINNYSYKDIDLKVGTYSYRLKQVDYNGSFEYSEVIEVEIIAPEVFALEQNYPNPFNPGTKIKFSLPTDSKVTLTVFDILGQEVANLVSGNLPAGSHEINFNASNINSGVFFYRINVTGVDGTNFTSVKKMILTK